MVVMRCFAVCRNMPVGRLTVLLSLFRLERALPMLRRSASGTKRRLARCKAVSGVGGKADLPIECPAFSV
jgi:hypothetical protein